MAQVRPETVDVRGKSEIFEGRMITAYRQPPTRVGGYSPELDVEQELNRPRVEGQPAARDTPTVCENKRTLDEIRAFKGRCPLAALTASDFPTARLLDEAGVPLLLVGDSLGMVVLGFPDTTHVTMEHMEHHTRAVARAKPEALLGADLPYRSYESPESAVVNSRRLMQAGAEFVKAEGGVEILPAVRAILADGIPFCGHVGMLPQHVLEEGGKYRIKGRDEAGRKKLLSDVAALEAAGAFACVLELVTPLVAAEITRASSQLLTIGIGSGPNCDGQILVTHDLIGAFPWFTPRFVTPRAQTGPEIRRAVDEWMKSLALGPIR